MMPSNVPHPVPSNEMGIDGESHASTYWTTITSIQPHRKSSPTATETTTASSKRFLPHHRASAAETPHHSAPASARGTLASAKAGSHVINHEEIMAHVMQSIISQKTSDEKFCECLKDKKSVHLILPPNKVFGKKMNTKGIPIKKKVTKVFDPNLYQRTLDSMSVQSDELLHAEHLWKVGNDQKHLALTCTTKSSKSPSVKAELIKSHQFGRAIDWGMEKEFWLSYIPSKCKVHGFASGRGGFWTSERVSTDPKTFKELEIELVTGNPIPPAERCARYECQMEWEVYHKLHLDKKAYGRSTDSRKNTQLKKSLHHYRDYAQLLISNLKHETSKSLRIDATAEGRRYKRAHHDNLDRIYKAYRILQNVERNTQSLPPILATRHLASSHQNKLWMNLLNKGEILELITNSISPGASASKPCLTSPQIVDHDDPTTGPMNPEHLSCDYPELLNPEQKSPGIIWPRNISLLEIPGK